MPMVAEQTARKLYLVDGTSQLFRAFFAIRGLSNAQGMPTNAVYGFTTMLRKLIRDERPAYLAVAFDLGGPVFRHESYAEYKANRPPAPEELNVQTPYAKEVCTALGIPLLERPGFEADDLIATVTAQARQAGFEVVIVASDKDLLQLVTQDVHVLNPVNGQRLGPAEVEASFGVRPELVRDVLALMGDAVDNVPGVPGVGQKTALSLVARYGEIERVLAHAARHVALWEARDELLEAVDRAGEEASLSAATVERLTALGKAFRARAAELAETERDAEAGARLEAALVPLGAVAGAPARLLGRPGRAALKELKAGLKALERGSARRVWTALHAHADQARLSKELVTLHGEVPVAFPAERLAVGRADSEHVARLFDRLGFASLAAAPPLPTQELAREGAPARPSAEPAPSYAAVQTADELPGLAARLAKVERVALSLLSGPGDPLSARLVGFALAWGAGQAIYVPLRHRYLGSPPQPEPAAVWDALAPLLSAAAPGKVVHDLKRAAHLLRREGVVLGATALDTHVAAFLLDPGHSDLTLSQVASDYLGASPGAPQPAEAAEGLAVEQAALEQGRAAELTWRLAGALSTRLGEAGLMPVYERLDGPLLPLLVEMEVLGIRVDTTRLARMSVEMGQAIAATTDEIHTLAGGSFNLDSPRQLREVLFERLKLTPGRKTEKSKAASTDAQTLEELVDRHPIATKLLEYRELSKLKSTYVDALPRLVRPETGRVHTTFDPTGAATGRLSSAEPNLQNIPVRRESGRRIREAFIPEDGFVFLAADYSQIELRVLAHMARDPELIAAFRVGEDIHRLTAARVFDVLPDLVTDAMRRRAKAVNFGILYGMSESRLAREQGIGRAEARQVIEAYFARFGRVGEYIEGVRRAVVRDGYVRTLFGRLRRFPQLAGPAPRPVKEQALRAAVNTTIQGSAADIMKLAMLAVAREIERGGLGARLLLQVHDELLLEVPEDELLPTSELVRREMEGVGALEVPLVVEEKRGRNWLEAT